LTGRNNQLSVANSDIKTDSIIEDPGSGPNDRRQLKLPKETTKQCYNRLLETGLSWQGAARWGAITDCI